MGRQQRERTQVVLELLRANDQLSVSALADRFGVSEMTIRRDLEALERQGLCRRVYGGAVAAPSRSYEPPFILREQHNAEAKERIGRAAAGLLSDGETVFIDIGTTTLQVAKALPGHRHLSVVTPSLRIAALLAEQAEMRVIALGGMVRPGEQSMVGETTERMVREFYVDTCVLGVGGIHATAGLTEYNLDDAAVKRTVVKQARRVIVVADASKVGGVAFSAIAPAASVDVLVSDVSPTDAAARELVDAGVELITA